MGVSYESEMPPGRELLQRWHASLRQLQATRLIILPCCTGALTGAATIVFVEMLRLVQWLAIGSTALPLHVLPGLRWYHVVLAPAAGGLVLGPLVHFLAPEVRGHGVPEVIEAVMLGGGRIRRRVAVVKSLASAITIGSGGSVGREGPIVQIGAGVGSALGQILRLPSEQLKTLAACGAGGGIAAVFNAPIAGAFFALEVVTGNFAMPSFGPVVLCSVMATVVSRAYFGDHPAFIVQPYRLESFAELGLYAGLGVVAGLVSAAFIWVMDRFESVAARSPIPKVWRPAVGGLVLGVLIFFIPNLYGVGYVTMDGALSGKLPWTLLALLVPAKIIATSLTLAYGGSGGVFQPSLYIGAVTGGLYGSAVHAIFPHMTAGPGAYALVGMAGVLSAATHSPITSLLLLFEVSGDYAIILPVMIVTTLASLVGRVLKRDSLYTLPFSRRGIDLHRREDLIMRSHTVGEIMRPAGPIIRDRTPVDEIVHYFLDHDVQRAYVTDENARFVGTISIHDIKMPHLLDLGPVVIASDVAETNQFALAPEHTLADSMDQFLSSQDDELPVVNRDGGLVGVVSRADVLQVYSTELLRHEYLGVGGAEGHSATGRVMARGNGVMVAAVATPIWLRGRSLRDANLRSLYNLTVVAIRRGTGGNDELPDPEEPLRPGEVLVVIGKRTDIDRFRHGE
jgi:chloride channel protein, CIC family